MGFSKARKSVFVFCFFSETVTECFRKSHLVVIFGRTGGRESGGVEVSMGPGLVHSHQHNAFSLRTS